MSKRLHLYGKSLLEKNIHPDVIFPSGDLPSVSGCYEGINYRSFKIPLFQKPYMPRQLSAFFAAFLYGRICYQFSKSYSVIFIAGFGWFALFFIIVGSHLGGARVILEVNENPYSPEGGRLDPLWIRKLRRGLMLNVPFKYADGFLVISEPLKSLVNRYRRKNSLIAKVPILTEKPSEMRIASRNLEHPFILHAGALSETKDGVTAVFKAFLEACKGTKLPLRFILTLNVISTSLRKRIETIISDKEFKDRIIFKGYITGKELDDLRCSATMAIVNKPSNWQNDFNFPTKLGELLANGVPVIASSNGEMGRYLKNNENAFLVKANDSEAMTSQILFILNNPEMAAKVGENGKKLAKEYFCYDNYSDLLAEIFNSLSA